MSPLVLPCPVRLGVVTSIGPEADLHKYALEKNLFKMDKLLKNGVDVDCVNNLGQTSLFCAALVNHAGATELLLRCGADPNHRCGDRSTPVHAAVFSCNPWLLSGLLDAGGDLRLHDHDGRTPSGWLMGEALHNAKMHAFLKSCMSHVQQLLQSPTVRNLHHSSCSIATSSKTLLRSPSLLDIIKSRGSELHLSKRTNKKASCTTLQCFGFGKMSVDKQSQTVGVLASIPLIGDSDLCQADDESLLSFTCGSLISMTNYSWKGTRVTLKEMRSPEAAYQDLLLNEQYYCSQLFHPHLLQLMAVSFSAALQRTSLVFERVHVGSLHDLLHHKRGDFPVLHTDWLLSIVLQVCEGLLYVHSRRLVMRSLSSHSVMLTSPGVAKLTGLGFMVPNESASVKPPAQPGLPADLYNWAAPEAIRQRPCTDKADLYSLCTIIQEVYTDEVPWGPAEPCAITQAACEGGALGPDDRVPQPYYDLVGVGMQPRARDRTHSLQDVCYTLRSDIKRLSQPGRQSSAVQHPPVGGQGPAGSTSIEKAEAFQGQWSELDEPRGRDTEQEEQEGEEQEEEEAEEQEEDEAPAPSPHHHPDLTFPAALPRRPRPSAPPGDSLAEARLYGVSWSEGTREGVSAIVLNIKVSQVLLQQAARSLVAVETALRCWEEADGVDEVDGMWRSDDPAHARSPTTSCSSDASGCSLAVGPPPQYRPLPQGAPAAAAVAGRLAAQLLSGEYEPLSAADVALLLGHFPPGRYHLEEQPSPSPQEEVTEGSSSSVEEPSLYSSALGDSFISAHPRRTLQQVTPVSRLQPIARPQDQDERFVVSSEWSSPQDLPTTQHTVDEASWADERTFSLEPLPALASDFHRPAQTQRRHAPNVVQRTGGITNPTLVDECLEEHCVPSSSELEADFYTVNQSFSVTFEGLDADESTQEDPDVTLEVCRPEDPGPKEEQMDGEDKCPYDMDDYEEMDGIPVLIGREAPSVLNPNILPDLAELSSITCSPSQLQERLLPLTPFNRPPPPCNSTPCSPAVHQRTPGGPTSPRVFSSSDEHPQSSRPTDEMGATDVMAEMKPPGAEEEYNDPQRAESELKVEEEYINMNGDVIGEEEMRFLHEPGARDGSDDSGREGDPDAASLEDPSASRPAVLCLLEDTTRAHSTLDEALQDIILESDPD